jgi:hypothetical protein
MGALRRRIDGTLEALRATPGIAAAATSMTVPGVPFQYDIDLRIVEAPPDGPKQFTARDRIVSSGYFNALQIPVVAGTDCSDNPPTPTAVVNRAFQALYLPDRPASGSHVQEVTSRARARSATIVGVVGDAREQGLNEPPAPTIYWCSSAPNPTPVFLVRTRSEDSATMTETVRRRIREIEPTRAVYELRPLEQRLDDTLAEARLRTALLASFAMVAVSLAAVGLYGTLSYIVNMRRREIGLRMAMGALRGSTVMLFLKQGILVTIAGCVVGVWLSAALGRGLSGMLYGVTPLDVSTFAGVLALMIAIGALASVWPALRAARVDPVRALRED